MQKRSEDNRNETSEDITSQNIQYQYHPPCFPTIDQQYTNQFQIPQNNGLVQNNIYPTGILNPGIPAAQQHYDYALYQQQPMQQPPQQQMYYQPYPQQQQNPSLGDLNAALHLTSALINQITANTNNPAPFAPPNLLHAPIMAQPPTAQNQNTTAKLENKQPPPRRTINFDHVEIPDNNISASLSQFQHQKARPLNGFTDRSREELLLPIDWKEDTAQQETVKRRRSKNTKRQKKSGNRNGGHDQSIPVFKRKEPPELQHSELKMDLKATKRHRQSDSKQVKVENIHPIDPGFGGKNGQSNKPTPKAKTEADRVDPTTDKSLNVSVVVPEDEHLVSPYIVTVMRQYKRCSLKKKGNYQQNLDLGYPGLECIHCTGPNSHQYFHSNSKSISSNMYKIGDHLLTCSGVPDALKKSIKELKDEHKSFKCQNRKRFFDDLFDRLLRDYKKDEICTDSKEEHLPETENKTTVCGGSTNGMEEAKSASSLAAQTASVDLNENPLVRAEDEQLVDAFVFFVASQYKRCIVDGSQRSRYALGFPGLACIHCAGQRKFYYQDAKNLRKNFSYLFNHLTECEGASDTVKGTLSKLHDARRNKYQNAESFFINMWSRLHGESCDKELGAIVKKQRINAPAEPKSRSDAMAAVKSGQKVTFHLSKTSLVLVEDKQLASDFLFTLMSQFRHCKLDLLTKGNRLKFGHGHPGLECIHCVGPNSRKFFYGSSNLLISNFHQLYTHLLECKSAPATLKKSLKKLKNDHGTITQNDREPFLNAIWARLQHECDAGLEEKKSPIKSKANEKTDKQQTSKRVSGGRSCYECRKKKQKCDGKKWYCLYNVGSMVTDKDADKQDTASTRQTEEKKSHSQEVPLSTTAAAENSFLCRVISKDSTQISYPHAPMGQLWLDKSFAATRPQSDLSDEASIDIHAGGTLIGRRYVWDEGYFVDQHHDVDSKPLKKNYPILRGCTCGADHSYTAGVNMESDSDGTKNRRSERSGGSMRTSTVLSKLADGTLSPHTLIYPDEYTIGPELRFNKNLMAENVQPFSIRVSPDALFLADLHAHLSDSEIIGFLGGHYSSSEKCIYIQAAFPCKATDRIDAGDTDVEMDPVSQIYAREAISNHGLSVVGWYHSHPTFQPNPSVTDIENQASYQQLFQGDNETGNITGDDASAIPFVGLIIGTYDGQNPTSESVMRWFHVISKKADGKDVNYPMQLKTTHRHFRVLDNELRPAMTSQGAIIRQDLESKYLSCPITKRSQPSHIEASELGDNTHSTASSTKMAGQQTQKKRPDDHQDVRVTSSSITETEKAHNVAIMENDRPALLLSETLFEQTRQGNEAISWKFKSAIPLYFTSSEKEILQMDADTIPNDVLAGIIWFAVEREQANPARKGESLLPRLVSPSSRAILELLLRLSFTGTDDMQRKLYEVIHSLESLEDSESKHDTSSDEMRFNDIDAVISHKVDAVLSHYCSSTQKKINPFKSWSGAGDKGKNIVAGIVEAGNPPSTSTIGAANSWAHYYLTEVLRMGCDQVGDRKVYRGGSKMKRGQKIASCLLKWARRMQLRPDFEAVMGHKSCNEGDLKFDSETSHQVAPIKNGYIFVVAEVMRLLAARWSETAGTPSRQSRRG